MTDEVIPSSSRNEIDLGAVHRDEWGRILALLVARFRRLDLAEDALADAFESAARKWPVDGTPNKPAAWLLTVARRNVLDRLRAEAMAQKKQPLIAIDHEIRERLTAEQDMLEALTAAPLQDDRLRMVFLACHPALARESQAALALRLVLGLPTSEIARLFLVSEPTMAARVTRAKKKIAAARIPFALPEPDQLADRVESAVRTAYLCFTAGYAPTDSDALLRTHLADEAITLTRLLVHLLPDSTEARAALAVMLLQHSRRDARTAPDGSLVLLAEQDRTRWYRTEIQQALEILATLEPRTPYAAELTLQARVAAVHATAESAESTDWHLIATLYGQLEQLTRNPVVRLNRAVAVAEAAGPAHGLELLEGLEQDLPRSHRLPAVEAELARRAGDTNRALAAYERAIERCTNEVELTHLRERCDELSATVRRPATPEPGDR